MAVQLSARVVKIIVGMVCTLAAIAGIAGGAVVDAAELRVVVTSGDDQPVSDAAVVLRSLDESPALPSEPQAQVDQIDREFVPSAIAVPVNTRVLFPNKDDIRHHVYSFSEAKSFELPLYTGTPARPIEFPREGIVTIACNIHDWMIGHIYVLDSPWHGVTDEAGRWQIGDLPEGRYALEVWHHAMADSPKAIAEFDLDAQASHRMEARVDIASGPSPRRAPRPGRRGYR
jgi:plastocyanin